MAKKFGKRNKHRQVARPARPAPKAAVHDDLVDLIRPGQAPKPGMDVIQEATREVTAEQLRRAAETNPDHPIAEVFKRAVEGFGDLQKLYVEHADLQGLLEDRDVRREMRFIGGRRVFRKVLGSPRRPLLDDGPKANVSASPVVVSDDDGEVELPEAPEDEPVEDKPSNDPPTDVDDSGIAFGV